MELWTDVACIQLYFVLNACTDNKFSMYRLIQALLPVRIRTRLDGYQPPVSIHLKILTIVMQFKQLDS